MVDGGWMVDGWWMDGGISQKFRGEVVIIMAYYGMVKFKVQMEAFSQCHLGLREGNYEVFPHW